MARLLPVTGPLMIKTAFLSFESADSKTENCLIADALFKHENPPFQCKLKFINYLQMQEYIMVHSFKRHQDIFLPFSNAQG